MKTSNINESINFRALYKPSYATIEKKAGKSLADAVNIAEPSLQKTAVNMDLYIVPYAIGSLNRGIYLTMTKNSKNIIKNFFTKLKIKYDIITCNLDFNCCEIIDMFFLSVLNGKDPAPKELAELIESYAKNLVIKTVSMPKI